MSFPIDHIVVAVSDLQSAIAGWRRLGFTVVEGGEHPGRGSRNALVVFADGAYFEIIAFDRAVPDFRWWQVLDRVGDGLVDFALLPSDIEADVAAARARGLDIGLPIAGGRTRPDGVRLDWKTARSPRSDLPFLCGADANRTLRVPDGEARIHPNGAQGVASLVVAVANLEESVARWTTFYGAEPATIHALPGLGLHVAHLAAGAATVTLAAPEGEGAAGAAIAAYLARRGESPYAIGLIGATPGRLDPAFSHGVLLEFVSTSR